MAPATHAQGTALDTRVIGRRVAATVVDLLLLSVIVGALSAPVTLAENLDGSRAEALVDGLANRQIVDGLYALVLLFGSLAVVILGFGYYVVMEGRFGQTLGKMALGIKVVREDGAPAGSGAILLRTLLRPVDGWFGIYGVAFVAALLSRKNRRLGDMVAKTLVVRA